VTGVQAKFLRIRFVSSTGGTGLTARFLSDRGGSSPGNRNETVHGLSRFRDFTETLGAVSAAAHERASALQGAREFAAGRIGRAVGARISATEEITRLGCATVN